ncbi:branched-chain amino acid ABC transporter permease [Azorhizobium oxalatiphilum]|uniref:Branched-chain amino acid ABC transporter permease n=1 Tax=Azorhizobium oxalatiphilum TaxID=980631 RepID=A0A917BJE0_9HYPH|nr:branched-chain amino acid ABC transporter permease [Azorhizobium oxalatiphilum]GGF48403.1 branched-chain amino acid ABC transporter permease [Azorhizobium oxalatiphilum]
MSTSSSAPASSTPARDGLGKVALIAIAVGVLAFAVLPLLVPTYQVSILTEILIFAVLAMAVDILAGYTGRTPLCHGAIFGVATYVVVYWSQQGGAPVTGLLLGVAAATLVGAIFGLLAIRTSGVYFLLLTLALGMIVWGVCLRWTSVTGGENGLRGSVRPEMLAGHMPFYYAVFAVVGLITFIMWRFVRSPFGLTLRGIRDSESRMRALGYNVSLHLFLAFTISGFFAGLAGALYAMFNDFVSPSTVALSQSVEGLLMAITGGIGTLFGAFIGAAAIIGLENFVSQYTERWPTVLGLMFILIMIFAPQGVIGRVRDLVRRR